MGGAAYISSLIDGIPEAANVDQYARIVKSAARRRRMIEVANAAVIEAMERGTDTDEIIERLCENLEAVRTDPASRGLYLVRAADIDAVRVNWAWDGRVALGALSLFVGDPGLGKTTAAVEVAARVSKGDLPGDLHGRPVPVLIATAEDALTVLRARLEAASADLNKVSFVVMQRDGLAGSITLPDDVPELQRRVEQERARLVIIDPIMGHLSGKVDSHRDASLRRALAPLCRMAEATDAAVIGIAHLNKSQVADLIRRVGGSVALSAAARSVLLLTRDPDDDTEEGPDRVLAHGKCNLGPQMEPLRLRIEGREVIGPDGPIPTSGIEWLGTAEGVTVTDMLGSATEGDHRKLLRWIQKRGGRTTERELARGPRHYRTSGAAATALEELVAMGAGEWHEPDRTWSGRWASHSGIRTGPTVATKPPMATEPNMATQLRKPIRSGAIQWRQNRRQNVSSWGFCRRRRLSPPAATKPSQKVSYDLDRSALPLSSRRHRAMGRRRVSLLPSAQIRPDDGAVDGSSNAQGGTAQRP